MLPERGLTITNLFLTEEEGTPGKGGKCILYGTTPYTIFQVKMGKKETYNVISNDLGTKSGGADIMDDSQIIIAASNSQEIIKMDLHTRERKGSWFIKGSVVVNIYIYIYYRLCEHLGDTLLLYHLKRLTQFLYTTLSTNLFYIRAVMSSCIHSQLDTNS